MPEKINSLQFKAAKLEDGTWTDSNSLSEALLTKPHMFQNVAYAMGNKFALQYLTAGTGRVSSEFNLIDNAEYAWPLYGSYIKSTTIATTNGGANVGQGFAPFELELDEDYLFKGVIVTFESGIQARTQTSATPIGNAKYRYTFQIDSADPQAFVPPSDLISGKKLAPKYTAYEEGSNASGTFQSFPNWFRNQTTIMRNSKGITGSASTDVMVLEIGGDQGSKSAYWMPANEYQQMMLWQQQIELSRWFSVYNKTAQGEIALQGDGGYAVRTGSGVLEQISPANTVKYNTLTSDLLIDFMAHLQNAGKYAENTKWMVFTGNGGFKTFQETILSEYTNVSIVDTTFTTRSGEKLHFDNQNFVTYKGILNTEITLVNNPVYSDPSMNNAVFDGFPVQSYEFTFMDFGDYGGEPNVSLVAKEGRALETWYEGGSTSPNYTSKSKNRARGYNAKRMASSSYDGYICHWLTEQGVKITNPTSCGRLILNV